MTTKRASFETLYRATEAIAQAVRLVGYKRARKVLETYIETHTYLKKASREAVAERRKSIKEKP